ncbi:MAG: M3 family oligoendopeptidase [Lachnospiraceae bacterium]|jgi:M3 family oligoendopeptidase|nr:M3 family oligoendopeptidase [Lachnospiraceae bacterium]
MKFEEMPYSRPDMEEITRQFRELNEEFDRASSGEELFEVHRKYYRLTDHFSTLMTIASIRHDIDVSDPFYDGEQKFYDSVRPSFLDSVVAYQKKLYYSRFRPYLEEKIGHPAFKNIELAMKSIDPGILTLMSEENALESAYGELIASASVEWAGEQRNLSRMEPFMHSPDRETRRQAWKTYEGFFTAHAEQLDELYDRLVKNRTAQAAALGYDNYLPLGYCRMNRNCWDRADIEQFRRQIREDIVPFAEKLHEQRRRRLGLSELRYYDEDVFFTDGNPVPAGTPEQILEAGRRMYSEMSPETGAFMDFMCSNEMLDVLGRSHKKTGGYMTYLPDYKTPFIFANFNGTSSDVDVITHECGHAFQAYISADDPIREHADITMDIAETHSTSMEFFTEPWMKMFFGNRAQDYIDMHFESEITFLPYGTMVDEFQDICYSDPGLSPHARNGVWRDLEKQYKPHLNYEGSEYYEKGAFWQNKHHIYESPLYYIDYCIAGIDALQYKAWMDRDRRAAWESYLKLCRLSASDFFTGLLPAVGLIVPFEDGCMRHVLKDIIK